MKTVFTMPKKKIRILQFSIASSMGGRTQYVLNLWRDINRDKFIFDFITFSKEEDFKPSLDLNPGKVYYLKAYPEKDRQEFIKEFNEILKNGYDVIEIHTSYWKDTIIEELALQAGISKIIIHGHSTGITQITEKNKNQESMLIQNHYKVKARLNENVATDFWACSRECADWLFYPNISVSKVKIVPNTIDTLQFAYSLKKHKKLKDQFELQNNFVFGFVGRLEPVKNLAFLFDVFYECQKRCNYIKLVIVGDGSMRKSLEQVAEDKNITDKVIFAGYQSKTESYYQLMDCFLLPSLFEGIPISAIEAQCSGLKCLLSDCITHDVAVTNNVSFLPLSNKDKWVSEMLEISNGYDRSDASEILIEKGLDSKKQIMKLEKMYSTLNTI